MQAKRSYGGILPLSQRLADSAALVVGSVMLLIFWWWLRSDLDDWKRGKNRCIDAFFVRMHERIPHPQHSAVEDTVWLQSVKSDTLLHLHVNEAVHDKKVWLSTGESENKQNCLGHLWHFPNTECSKPARNVPTGIWPLSQRLVDSVALVQCSAMLLIF